MFKFSLSLGATEILTDRGGVCSEMWNAAWLITEAFDGSPLFRLICPNYCDFS